MEEPRIIAERILANVERVIIGKTEAVRLALIALMCQGHVLIEDVPGVGKTVLARSLAASMGCSFRRIQFTPDLLPSDVTGVSIYNQKSGDFEFRAGPIFSQVLLADEVNRSTPRTQSALLEAMEERQVTVDGETMPLPRPFLVLAPQNHMELEGTFPLPEAQLDRFLMRLRMGYPSKEADHEILARFRESNPIDDLKEAVRAEDLTELRKVCRRVLVDKDVEQYIVDLVHATREHPEVELGASPRAMLALYHTSQALAAMRGRAFVTPDDVKYLTPFVFEHRIIPKAQSHLRGNTAAEIVAQAVESVTVPAEQVSERR